MKTKDWILIGLVILALLGVGYFGYTLKKCIPDEIKCDTIYVHDTAWHIITDTVPWYIIKHDSIIYRDTVFKDVDTTNILKDYYAVHYYTRFWEDTLISVTKHDAITENKFISSELQYQLKKPLTVINNITNNYSYSCYITGGISLPLKDIKYVDLKLKYVTSKWYGEIGYNAMLNSPTIGGGITIFKFK